MPRKKSQTTLDKEKQTEQVRIIKQSIIYKDIQSCIKKHRAGYTNMNIDWLMMTRTDLLKTGRIDFYQAETLSRYVKRYILSNNDQ